jgi:hypothetical protein
MLDEKKMIHYVISCVDKFAEIKKINTVSAFKYLDTYNGLKALIDCYDIEHTLSSDDTINALTVICKRNGGSIE